jgi:hypothetical protein
MSGSGKGGDSRKNRRRSFKRGERENNRAPGQDSSRGGGKKAVDLLLSGEGKSEKKRGQPGIRSKIFERAEPSGRGDPLYERLRWTPPKPPAEPLPAADCAWCGKPIKDMSAAISDLETGHAVHFDCVIARIGASEVLEPGDAISYIGGGRFGIIHFKNPPDTKDFKIKKIFEWEKQDNRSEWRQTFSDHFSVT